MIRILSAIGSMTGLGLLGQAIFATGGLILMVGSLWFGFAYHYESKGAAKAVAKIEQKAAANVEKAQAARKSVQSIPDDQLNDQFRRD